MTTTHIKHSIRHLSIGMLAGLSVGIIALFAEWLVL